MLKEIKIIKFNRVVIPEDANSLDINTINVTDTTKRIACEQYMSSSKGDQAIIHVS